MVRIFLLDLISKIGMRENISGRLKRRRGQGPRDFSPARPLRPMVVQHAAFVGGDERSRIQGILPDRIIDFRRHP
jgi:hypothetical protein